ncbi:hypothetical protein ACQ4PT_072173 [Festuca glaucescens]
MSPSSGGTPPCHCHRWEQHCLASPTPAPPHVVVARSSIASRRSTPYIGCNSGNIYGVSVRAIVQGIGLGFTYGLAICSCALQLWVGRHLIACGKADGGEVVVALFAVILSGIGLNQAAT